MNLDFALVNRALLNIGMAPITAADKKAQNDAWLTAMDYYLTTMLESLAEVEWTGAKKRRSLTPSQRPLKVNTDFAFAYDLPLDCAKSVELDGQEYFEVEADSLFANVSPARLLYVTNGKRVSSFNGLFAGDAFRKPTEDFFTGGDARRRQRFEEEALKQFVRAGNVSPELREFFDKLLAGPDFEGNAAPAEGESRARVETDNEAQKAFAEKTGAERILDGDLYSREEKAEMLYAMERRAWESLERGDRVHRPTAALIARAFSIPEATERERVTGEIRELRKRYAGTPAEYLTPNGKPSNLLTALEEEAGKEAWYAVRTENFKKWFGDWERAERITAIENLEAKNYTPKTVTKREAKTLFQNFEPVKKTFTTDFFESKDERKKPRNVSKEANSVRNIALNVSFPGEIVGKLGGFFNSHKPNILSGIRELFEKSEYGYSSNYISNTKRPDGSVHKEHSNIEAYHNFVNKAEVDGTPYYIRFTVQELKARNELHAAHISEIEIINKKAGKTAAHFSDTNRGGTAQPAYDENLTDFFGSVKDKVSIVTDENGEPLPVFHGTSAEFDRFDPAKLKRAMYGDGFYFEENKERAQLYGGRVIPAFLSIKKPESGFRRANGYRTSNGYWLVKRPEQIKSATGNAGSFDSSNPSILFQTAYHGSPYRFDRFDSSHMGSGEGQQAFGWGLYFAGKKEVAEYYREQQVNRFIVNGEKVYLDKGSDLYSMYKFASEERLQEYIDDVTAIADEYAAKSTAKNDWNDKLYKKYSSHAKEAQKLIGKNIQREPGQLYEVDIPGDEEMLDWDKPLGEQPEKVLQALEGFKQLLNEERGTPESKHPDLTFWGSSIYGWFSDARGSDKLASQYLNSIGIKGIRYLDGSSRSAGKGSHNYVIFDDNDIEIKDIFFQMTREEIQAEAMRHESWQDWMKADVFAEAMGDETSYRQDDAGAEPQGREALEAWYEKQWNEARVLAREGALWDNGERTPANAEAVDPALFDEEERGCFTTLCYRRLRKVCRLWGVFFRVVWNSLLPERGVYTRAGTMNLRERFLIFPSRSKKKTTSGRSGTR